MKTFDTDKFRKSIEYVKEHGGSFRVTHGIDALFLWDKNCENYQIVFSSGLVVLFDDFTIGSNDTIVFFRWKKIDDKFHQIITGVLSIFESMRYDIGNIEVEI